jgi:hypothetical protein
MDDHPGAKDKSEVWRKDSLLVSCMFLTCCAFVFALITVPFWLSNESQKIISANATSTAYVVATQQAFSTATAVAHQKELETYEFVDHFDKNEYHWAEGSNDDEYSVDKKSVTGGVYLWEVKEVKKPFIAWEDFYRGVFSSNYDVYVDTRVVEGSPGTACSGLIFGMSDVGFDGGAYIFAVCNDTSYSLEYYNENEKEAWQTIVGRSYHPSIQADNWNRLEVSSHAANFALFINGVQVYETTENRYAKGDLAVIVTLDEGPAKIEFDNFGYQSR